MRRPNVLHEVILNDRISDSILCKTGRNVLCIARWSGSIVGIGNLPDEDVSLFPEKGSTQPTVR
jgi:hypothetical protein